MAATAIKVTAPPITGWYRNHANPKVTKNRGILIINAAKNTIMPAVPFKNPPTIGKYPSTSTKGLKNAQIPITIIKKNTTLNILVSVVFFLTVMAIISW